MESNVVVAAALMLLTVLATEFVINFEVRKMRDRRRKRRNYIVSRNEYGTLIRYSQIELCVKTTFERRE